MSIQINAIFDQVERSAKIRKFSKITYSEPESSESGKATDPSPIVFLSLSKINLNSLLV